MDSTSPEPWSQARCVEIDAAMRSLLCNEMHFNEKHIRVVPLSGLTGQNIVKLDEDCPLKRWYSGPTLLEAIDSFLVPTRSWQKPLRAVVQEVVSSDPSRARCELEVCVLQGKLRTDRSVAFYDTSKRPQAIAAAPASGAAPSAGVATKVGGHAEGDVAAGKDGEAAHGKYTAATATVLAHNGAPPGEGEHRAAGDAGTVLKAGERGRISLTNK
jgi:translation elongation factor EF-1alpha